MENVSVKTVLKRGSLNRGRFTKYYENKGEYVCYWGMCDVTCMEYKVSIPSGIFYEFLNCVNSRSYKNMKNILKDLSIHAQRFLLDGVSPAGWDEMSEALNTCGISETLCYSGLGGIKSVSFKNIKVKGS